ncbi:MAG: 30S ribosomal protein S4 [Methanomassiliicoccales archaeon]|jgi:small subunit ribosomal protein S4|nr:30S ribosomal protein S4 [Methanomassiliicoccales archaeon]
MGDPKFPRRTYDTPSHPWQGERIKEEHELVKEFGLKNKRELWKAKSILRNYRKQSRDLQARIRTGEEQAKTETHNLLKACAAMGLLPMEGASLDDVLGLKTEALLNRRLQTMVFRKGLATSPNQARQMIFHGHIAVDGRKVTVPGYLMARGEEEKITYLGSSPFNNEMHPYRVDAPKVMEARARRLAREARREREEEQRGGGRGGRGGRGGGGRFPRRAERTVEKVKEVADVVVTKDLPEAPKEE